MVISICKIYLYFYFFFKPTKLYLYYKTKSNMPNATKFHKIFIKSISKANFS